MKDIDFCPCGMARVNCTYHKIDLASVPPDPPKDDDPYQSYIWGLATPVPTNGNLPILFMNNGKITNGAHRALAGNSVGANVTIPISQLSMSNYQVSQVNGDVYIAQYDVNGNMINQWKFDPNNNIWK